MIKLIFLNVYIHNYIFIDVAIAEGTPDKLELQNIRTCYVNNDVCILINGSAIERDNIICLCRDFIINRFEDKNQPIYYSESMNVLNNVDKVYDIIEVSNDSLYQSKLTNNEMINEYLGTKQKYLLLTRNGIKVFERIFPIHQLLNVYKYIFFFIFFNLIFIYRYVQSITTQTPTMKKKQ